MRLKSWPWTTEKGKTARISGPGARDDQDFRLRGSFQVPLPSAGSPSQACKAKTHLGKHRKKQVDKDLALSQAVGIQGLVQELMRNGSSTAIAFNSLN